MNTPRNGDTIRRLHVSRGRDYFGFDVFITQEVIGGDRHIIDHKGDMTLVERGHAFPPTFELEEEMAEQLLGQLLEMRVVPKGRAAPDDLLKAKDAHLEDMRRLVFERANDSKVEFKSIHDIE